MKDTKVKASLERIFENAFKRSNANEHQRLKPSLEKYIRLVAKRAFEAGQSNHMDDDGNYLREPQFEYKDFNTYWKETYGNINKNKKTGTPAKKRKR